MEILDDVFLSNYAKCIDAHVHIFIVDPYRTLESDLMDRDTELAPWPEPLLGSKAMS